jgi:hypothetical protein
VYFLNDKKDKTQQARKDDGIEELNRSTYDKYND